MSNKIEKNQVVFVPCKWRVLFAPFLRGIFLRGIFENHTFFPNKLFGWPLDLVQDSRITDLEC